MRSTRQHDFSVAIYTETGITYRLTDINSSRKPDISLCTIASCAERRSIIVHPKSLSSPCRAMLNTARDSTRLVARLSHSAVIGRKEKGHGGRACRLAHSGRIGSSLGIPSIQLSRITGDYFCPLALYSTLFSSFTTENLKIFSELPEYRKFSAVESFLRCLVKPCVFVFCREKLFLSPHFYWQEKRHFLNQNRKIILLFFVSLFHVFPLTVVIFVLPYFFSPRPEYISALYSGGVPSTSQHLCRNFFCDNEDHLRSDGHQMFQPERPQPAHRQAVPCTEVSLFTQPLSWLAVRCC